MIAVVFLVWGPLGASPLRQFLAGYDQHRAGVEHELVVLLNGVQPQLRAELEADLAAVEHRSFSTARPVQDLAAYAEVARGLSHDRICFLNTHSRILAPDWLAKLDAALGLPYAGLVGATGSWASFHSAALRSLLLPNPYRGLMPPRQQAAAHMQAIAQEQVDAGAEPPPASVPAPAGAGGKPLRRKILDTLVSLTVLPEELVRFEGFPAHHLRTNAFMADRSTFAGLSFGELARKLDAHALESGRRSLTRQIERRGLRALVVDRDGEAFEQQRWPLSGVFWQRDQQSLLIADNRTRSYTNGDIERRRMLSAFAWGRRADPEPARR